MNIEKIGKEIAEKRFEVGLLRYNNKAWFFINLENAIRDIKYET